jgi:hypothetical protein
MDDEQKTEAPWAPELGEWWNTKSANAADRERAAIEVAEFREQRALRYVSEGREDIGGFVKTYLGETPEH